MRRKIFKSFGIVLLAFLCLAPQISHAGPLEDALKCEETEKGKSPSYMNQCKMKIVATQGKVESDVVFNELKQICEYFKKENNDTQWETCNGYLGAYKKDPSYCAPNSASWQTACERAYDKGIQNGLIYEASEKYDIPILKKCIGGSGDAISCINIFLSMYGEAGMGGSPFSIDDMPEIQKSDLSDEVIKGLCVDIVYESFKESEYRPAFISCVQYAGASIDSKPLCEYMTENQEYYETCLMASLGMRMSVAVSSFDKPKNTNHITPADYLATCESIQTESLRERCMTSYEYICKNDPEFQCPKIQKSFAQRFENIQDTIADIFKGGSGQTFEGGIYSANVAQGVRMAILLLLITIVATVIDNRRKRREGIMASTDFKKLFLWTGIAIVTNLALFAPLFFILGYGTAVFSGVLNRSISYGTIMALAFFFGYTNQKKLHSNIGFAIFIAVITFIPPLLHIYASYGSLADLIIHIVILFIFANLAYLLSQRFKEKSIDFKKYLIRSILFFALLFLITIIGFLAPSTASCGSGCSYFSPGILNLFIGAPTAIAFIPGLATLGSAYITWVTYYFLVLSIIFGSKKAWPIVIVIIVHIILLAYQVLIAGFAAMG